MKRGVIVQREAKQTSNAVQEFSRFAHTYDTYNVIQAKVAQTLVSKLPSKTYKQVIDIGCGSGEVYKNFISQGIEIESFYALDSSVNMLAIHPTNENIKKICTDFNAQTFLEDIPSSSFDMLISSSALQWSTDLSATLQKISTLSPTMYVAVFTSGTFRTLHQTAGLSSPIYNIGSIQEVCRTSFKDVRFEVHHYKLDFASTRDMFTYIKKSGVSSGERKLSYAQTKALMREYPLKYLEFEVLFIEARN